MRTIFFVHKGNDYYLKIAIEQAHKSNPNIELILLGDNSNKFLSYCKHFYVADYFIEANKFAKYFVNYSPNPANYELFCFQRWFVIDEFISKHPQYNDSFLYCDSDTMLFDDVSPDLDSLGNAPMAIEYEESPGFAFFNKGTISEFCNLLQWLYTSEEGIRYIKNLYEDLMRNKQNHGISDMTAFKYYCRNIHKGHVISAEKPTRNLIGGGKNIQQHFSCYDHNVNCADNYKMKGGIKEFSWYDGKPYAFSYEVNDKVLFKGIHFQGIAKYRMIKLFYSDRLYSVPVLCYLYYIEFNLKRLKLLLKQFIHKFIYR